MKLVAMAGGLVAVMMVVVMIGDVGASSCLEVNIVGCLVVDKSTTDGKCYYSCSTDFGGTNLYNSISPNMAGCGWIIQKRSFSCQSILLATAQTD